jgi:MacB-like periplasmic core domain
MNATLLDPLPLPNAERLVVIRTAALDDPAQSTGSSLADYLAWKERSRAFDAMELSISGPHDLGAEENGVPAERITGTAVTAGFFATLGVTALHRRVFAESDNHTENRVVLISHRLWHDRYGNDPAIVNRQIRVDRGGRAEVRHEPIAVDTGRRAARAGADPARRLWAAGEELRSFRDTRAELRPDTPADVRSPDSCPPAFARDLPRVCRVRDDEPSVASPAANLRSSSRVAGGTVGWRDLVSAYGQSHPPDGGRHARGRAFGLRRKQPI